MKTEIFCKSKKHVDMVEKKVRERKDRMKNEEWKDFYGFPNDVCLTQHKYYSQISSSYKVVSSKLGSI